MRRWLLIGAILGLELVSSAHRAHSAYEFSAQEVANKIAAATSIRELVSTYQESLPEIKARLLKADQKEAIEATLEQFKKRLIGFSNDISDYEDTGNVVAILTTLGYEQSQFQQARKIFKELDDPFAQERGLSLTFSVLQKVLDSKMFGTGLLPPGIQKDFFQVQNQNPMQMINLQIPVNQQQQNVQRAVIIEKNPDQNSILKTQEESVSEVDQETLMTCFAVLDLSYESRKNITLAQLQEKAKQATFLVGPDDARAAYNAIVAALGLDSQASSGQKISRGTQNSGSHEECKNQAEPHEGEFVQVQQTGKESWEQRTVREYLDFLNVPIGERTNLNKIKIREYASELLFKESASESQIQEICSFLFEHMKLQEPPLKVISVPPVTGQQSNLSNNNYVFPFSTSTPLTMKLLKTGDLFKASKNNNSLVNQDFNQMAQMMYFQEPKNISAQEIFSEKNNELNTNNNNNIKNPTNAYYNDYDYSVLNSVKKDLGFQNVPPSSYGNEQGEFFQKQNNAQSISSNTHESSLMELERNDEKGGSILRKLNEKKDAAQEYPSGRQAVQNWIATVLGKPSGVAQNQQVQEEIQQSGGVNRVFSPEESLEEAVLMFPLSQDEKLLVDNEGLLVSDACASKFLGKLCEKIALVYLFCNKPVEDNPPLILEGLSAVEKKDRVKPFLDKLSANAARDLGDNPAAVACVRRCIELFESLASIPYEQSALPSIFPDPKPAITMEVLTGNAKAVQSGLAFLGQSYEDLTRMAISGTDFVNEIGYRFALLGEIRLPDLPKGHSLTGSDVEEVSRRFLMFSARDALKVYRELPSFHSIMLALGTQCFEHCAAVIDEAVRIRLSNQEAIQKEDQSIIDAFDNDESGNNGY